MAKPSNYEKNNLPFEIRKIYNEVIEKYQTIIHYENGHITKEELIKELSVSENNKEQLLDSKCCHFKDCKDKVSPNSKVYCIEYAYQHTMQGY